MALATQVLDSLYGRELRKRCKGAAEAVFSGDLSALGTAEVDLIVQNLPLTYAPRSSFLSPGCDSVTLCVIAGVASGRAEARRLLQSGGVTLNGEVLTEDRVVSDADLLRGRLLLLRRGNKSWRPLEVRD